MENPLMLACWAKLLLVGCLTCGIAAAASDNAGTPAAPGSKPAMRFAGVRYQVRDVARAVEFYTRHLGFKLGRNAGPAFASVSNGNLTLWLSGPGSSGARPLPDGRKQEPGGWNRVALEVDDLPARVVELKKRGVRFRNEIEKGPGGQQIQLEDPDGNPVELFQPAQ